MILKNYSGKIEKMKIFTNKILNNKYLEKYRQNKTKNYDDPQGWTNIILSGDFHAAIIHWKSS